MEHQKKKKQAEIPNAKSNQPLISSADACSDCELTVGRRDADGSQVGIERADDRAAEGRCVPDDSHAHLDVFVSLFGCLRRELESQEGVEVGHAPLLRHGLGVVVRQPHAVQNGSILQMLEKKEQRQE